MQKKIMKSKFASQIRHSNTFKLGHNPNKNLSISTTTTSNSQNKQKECKLIQDHPSNKEPQHEINDEMNDTMIEEYLEQEGLRILKKLNESIKTPKHNSVLINSQRLLTRNEKADAFFMNIILNKKTITERSNEEQLHRKQISVRLNNKPKPMVSVKKRNKTFLLGGSFNQKSIQDKSKDHLSYLLQNSDALTSFMNKDKKIKDIKSSINKPEQKTISLKKKGSKGIVETKTVLKYFTRMISNLS